VALTFRDFITGLRRLDIDSSRPVIVHASLSAFGEVHGGAETLLGALISSFQSVIMPTFTYKTMIIPEIGPPDNAMIYGSGKDTNRMAEIFTPDLPADPMMGSVAEALRKHANAHRSAHPILSFAGINARPILDAQTIKDPLLPIKTLIDEEGWVILMGVDQTVNTSIHYCEQLAGRIQFTRWALTPRGVVICPGFPGCSDGFEAVSPLLEEVMCKVNLGEGKIQAVPIVSVVDVVCRLIKKDPTALLCEREDCPRCNTVRAAFTML
jgi:aminoglycoside 3-N-acetyltransferase